MALEQILIENRDAILKKWFATIIESYPTDSQRFFSKQGNRFANPVGSSIGEGTAAIFDGLVSGKDLNTEEVCRILDGIIRIRAVQDFTPSQALEFIFLLKKVTKETVGGTIRKNGILEELLTFESRIDRLALLAFNIYMHCREKVYQLRANELRNRTSRILQRACQVWETRGECLPDELKEE